MVETPNAASELVFIEDMARMLGLSLEGARAACRQARLPASRVGKRWVTTRTLFLAFIEKQATAHMASRGDEDDDVARAVGGLPSRRNARKV